MSKHAVLSGSLVAKEGQAAPPADMATRSAAIDSHVTIEATKRKAHSVPLNFKLTPDLVRDFEIYAATHG